MRRGLAISLIILLLSQPVLSFAFSIHFLLAPLKSTEEAMLCCNENPEPKTCCEEPTQEGMNYFLKKSRPGACCTEDKKANQEKPIDCCDEEGGCNHSCCSGPLQIQQSLNIILTDHSSYYLGEPYSDINNKLSEYHCFIPSGFSGDSWRPPRPI